MTHMPNSGPTGQVFVGAPDVRQEPAALMMGAITALAPL